MIVWYSAVLNGIWFVHDGKTLLKLHGGPHSLVYCPVSRKRFIFKHVLAKVEVHERA